MPIELPPDVEKQARDSLRRFCAEELEIEIGELQARQFLKFILQELAPTFYNAGAASAEAYLRDRVADIEGVCHEPEFTYWPRTTSVRRK